MRKCVSIAAIGAAALLAGNAERTEAAKQLYANKKAAVAKRAEKAKADALNAQTVNLSGLSHAERTRRLHETVKRANEYLKAGKGAEMPDELKKALGGMLESGNILNKHSKRALAHNMRKLSAKTAGIEKMKRVMNSKLAGPFNALRRLRGMSKHLQANNMSLSKVGATSAKAEARRLQTPAVIANQATKKTCLEAAVNAYDAWHATSTTTTTTTTTVSTASTASTAPTTTVVTTTTPFTTSTTSTTPWAFLTHQAADAEKWCEDAAAGTCPSDTTYAADYYATRGSIAQLLAADAGNTPACNDGIYSCIGAKIWANSGNEFAVFQGGAWDSAQSEYEIPLWTQLTPGGSSPNADNHDFLMTKVWGEIVAAPEAECHVYSVDHIGDCHQASGSSSCQPQVGLDTDGHDSVYDDLQVGNVSPCFKMRLRKQAVLLPPYWSAYEDATTFGCSGAPDYTPRDQCGAMKFCGAQYWNYSEPSTGGTCQHDVIAPLAAAYEAGNRQRCVDGLTGRQGTNRCWEGEMDPSASSTFRYEQSYCAAGGVSSTPDAMQVNGRPRAAFDRVRWARHLCTPAQQATIKQLEKDLAKPADDANPNNVGFETVETCAECLDLNKHWTQRYFHESDCRAESEISGAGNADAWANTIQFRTGVSPPLLVQHDRYGLDYMDPAHLNKCRVTSKRTPPAAAGGEVGVLYTVMKVVMSAQGVIEVNLYATDVAWAALTDEQKSCADAAKIDLTLAPISLSLTNLACATAGCGTEAIGKDGGNGLLLGVAGECVEVGATGSTLDRSSAEQDVILSTEWTCPPDADQGLAYDMSSFSYVPAGRDYTVTDGCQPYCHDYNHGNGQRATAPEGNGQCWYAYSQGPNPMSSSHYEGGFAATACLHSKTSAIAFELTSSNTLGPLLDCNAEGGAKYRHQFFTCNAATEVPKKIYRKWFPPASAAAVGDTTFTPLAADRAASATAAAAAASAGGAYDTPTARALPDSGASGTDPSAASATSGGGGSGGSSGSSGSSSKKSSDGGSGFALDGDRAVMVLLIVCVLASCGALVGIVVVVAGGGEGASAPSKAKAAAPAGDAAEPKMTDAPPPQAAEAPAEDKKPSKTYGKSEAAPTA